MTGKVSLVIKVCHLNFIISYSSGGCNRGHSKTCRQKQIPQVLDVTLASPMIGLRRMSMSTEATKPSQKQKSADVCGGFLNACLLRAETSVT